MKRERERERERDTHTQLSKMDGGAEEEMIRLLSKMKSV